jgi:hypothetical protein
MRVSGGSDSHGGGELRMRETDSVVPVLLQRQGEAS